MCRCADDPEAVAEGLPDYLLGTDPTAPGQEWWIALELAEEE
jgi:hypothetical protein